MITESTIAELRPDLVRCCYRMLGDGAAAEDAAQEALLRIWRARDTYDPARASVRTWAFAIATRHCFDLLRSARRRELPSELVEPSRPGDPIGALLPAGSWITPLPDTGDPADIAQQRDTIRLAFVAALQRLSPRQRAALVLRDVYAFSAEETAAMLGTGTSAVHSALQRARRVLDTDRSVRAASDQLAGPAEDRTAEVDGRVLADFVRAFERHDVARLAALLHADVVSAMPPVAFWMSGCRDVTTAFAETDGCVGHRLLPTTANGGSAFGQYAPDGQVLRPFALLLVEVAGGRISRMTTCLDLTGRFAAFGLPEVLPQ